jgi:hypothetical protein
LAYAEGERQAEVAIAGEAKWRQRDAVDLVRALRVCGERGEHPKDDCAERQHPKYEGLVAFHPPTLWIIGPDAFAESPDLVFSVTVEDGGLVRLVPAKPDSLSFLAH